MMISIIYMNQWLLWYECIVKCMLVSYAHLT